MMATPPTPPHWRCGVQGVKSAPAFRARRAVSESCDCGQFGVRHCSGIAGGYIPRKLLPLTLSRVFPPNSLDSVKGVRYKPTQAVTARFSGVDKISRNEV